MTHEPTNSDMCHVPASPKIASFEKGGTAMGIAEMRRFAIEFSFAQ